MKKSELKQLIRECLAEANLPSRNQLPPDIREFAEFISEKTRKSVQQAGWLAVAVLVVALLAVILTAPAYDTLSFWFAVLIAGVGALNMLHATAYLAHNHAQPRFFAAFGIMIGRLM